MPESNDMVISKISDTYFKLSSLLVSSQQQPSYSFHSQIGIHGSALLNKALPLFPYHSLPFRLDIDKGSIDGKGWPLEYTKSPECDSATSRGNQAAS